jgi:hypothetical protein
MTGDCCSLRVINHFADYSDDVFFEICEDDTISLRADTVTADDM